jgi:hypothetical protein
MPGSPSVHERQYYASYLAGPTTLVTVGGAPAISAPLVFGGRYLLCCADTDIYLRQGGAGLQATTGDLLLAQGDMMIVNVDDATNNRISTMTATGVGGTLRVTRIDGATGSAAVHKAQFFAVYLGSCVSVAVDGGVHASTALVHGARYGVVCYDADVYIRQGAPAVTVDANQCLLPAGELVYINVDDATNDTVAVMSASGNSGTLRIVRIDDVA